MAVCDLDSRRAASGKTRVEQLFAARNAPPRRSTSTATTANCSRERTSTPSTISTPDHWHAQLALRGALRRQGRLSAKADDDDARRRRPAARRGGEDRTHPPGRQPAAVVGAERAIPQGVRVRPQRSRRPARAGRDRTADRSDRARRSAAAGAGESELRDVARSDAGGLTTPSSASIRRSCDTNGEPDVASRPGWLRNESLLPRHDHRLGRAPLRHGALGHERGTQRPVARSRARASFPHEQDLERARRVSHRADVSRQRHHDRVGQAAERHQVHRRRRLDLRLARRAAQTRERSRRRRRRRSSRSTRATRSCSIPTA